MSKTLSSSLAEAKLVPGPAASLIPEDFKPSTNLRVSFDGKDVEMGNLFRANECKRSPSILFDQEVCQSDSAMGIFAYDVCLG